MWRNLNKVCSGAANKLSLLCPDSIVQQQFRTTTILKRRHPLRLHKKNMPPKPFRSKNYIYDLVRVEDTEYKADIEVILTTHVEGLGNKGDKVSVRPYYAHEHLLLPGLAVYVTPENTQKFTSSDSGDEIRYSSQYAAITMNILSKARISVVMNKENPWVLQPWHVKASFRKCGFVVPEKAITLPPEPIKGPDMNIEGKEFFVIVMINNTEKVYVRCRIHHWSTNITERLPYEFEFWKKPSEPIHLEHAEILDSLPSSPKNLNST